MRTQQSSHEQVNEPSVQSVQQKIGCTETGRPYVPDGVLQRKRKYRQWPVDSCVIEVSPIRLEKKVERLDVADVFICGNYKNVVEYERIWYGVGIANRHQDQAQDQCARRVIVFIEQVHP